MLVPQGQFFQAGDERLDEKRGGNGGLKWVVSEIREQSLWTPSARRIREGRKGRPNRRTLRSGEMCFLGMSDLLCYGEEWPVRVSSLPPRCRSGHGESGNFARNSISIKSISRNL